MATLKEPKKKIEEH